MRKILNDPQLFVDEMLEGILAAHPGRPADGRRSARDRAGRRTDRGQGRDRDRRRLGPPAAVHGLRRRGAARRGRGRRRVRLARAREQMLEVTQAIDGGAGVLYIYGNYGGDVLNFDLATELAADEGIEVRTVLGADDVASAPKGQEARRRGIAGIFFLYKVAGARAAAGAIAGRGRRRDRAGGREPALHGHGALAHDPPPPAGPPSSCPKARWRSAWASTASPASGADRSRRGQIADELVRRSSQTWS